MPLFENNQHGLGIHALIVGVSDYVHLPGQDDPVPGGTMFGMKKLRTAALSAFNVLQWMKTADADGRLARPLASYDIILVPSANEATVPGLTDFKDDGTAANFRNRVWAWRSRVAQNKDNMALFYFAGHGMQRSKEDSVLLLSDFAAKQMPALANGFGFYDIFNGMAPSNEFPQMGITQVYFVDACRNVPAASKDFDPLKAGTMFDSYLSGRDEREAPVFFAAVNDSVAYGVDGKGSYFSLALIAALNSGAENPVYKNGALVWPVSAYTLATAVELQFKKLKTNQRMVPGGQMRDPVICYLPAPPHVDVSISVQPDDRRVAATIQVEGLDPPTLWQQPTPAPEHPYQVTLNAGVHTLSVEIDGGRSLSFGSRMLNQKSHTWEVRLP